jgi:predicted Zn-dependent protease with MMP-like domain
MQTFTLFPRAEFESLVAQALDELPPYFQAKMSNVEVVIEPWPTRDDLHLAGVPAGQTLLGLYHGVPLTQRGAHYQLVLPDRIIIFQGTIEQVYRTSDAIRAGVRHTVIHELAHHFGISDDRLHELGAY